MHIVNLDHRHPMERRTPLDVAFTLDALRHQTELLDAAADEVAREVFANVAARERIEALIERLIRRVDELDGDEDLEHDVGDEGETLDGYRFDDDEETGDDEPSLGALETHPCTHPHKWMMGLYWRWDGGSQVDWSAGSTEDLEEEHDGREPWLGWNDAGSTDGAAMEGES